MFGISDTIMAQSTVTRWYSVCALNFNLDFNLPKTKRKNMKKQAKMITLVMCLMSLIGISTASAQTLVLHHANGTTLLYNHSFIFD